MKADILRKAAQHADMLEQCAVSEAMALRFISITGYFYAPVVGHGGASPRTDMILAEDDPAFETVRQLLLAKLADTKAKAAAGLTDLGIDGHEVDKAIVDEAAAKSHNAKQEHATVMAVRKAAKAAGK